jgi:hypothetical protein
MNSMGKGGECLRRRVETDSYESRRRSRKQKARHASLRPYGPMALQGKERTTYPPRFIEKSGLLLWLGGAGLSGALRRRRHLNARALVVLKGVNIGRPEPAIAAGPGCCGEQVAIFFRECELPAEGFVVWLITPNQNPAHLVPII